MARVIRIQPIGTRDGQPRVRSLGRCERAEKEAYATESDAMLAGREHARFNRFRPSVAYLCPYGPHWHLSSRSP